MKLLLSVLLLFSISFTSFAQKARVLLAYNAFNSDKDTLEIGDTLSYNSENENELIFLKENAYLALMNENGSILEWKNKETGNYKIEFDESDTTFNGARKYIVRGYVLDRVYKNRTDKENMYLGMRRMNICRIPLYGIEVLGNSKSNYVKNKPQIFIEYRNHMLKEDEKIKQNTLKIEITDLRYNLLLTYELDTNYIIFDWNNLPVYKQTVTVKEKVEGKRRKQKVEREMIYEHSTVLYKFSSQTTKNRKISSTISVLSKSNKPLSYQDKYFQIEEKTTIGTFLQFLYSCEEYGLSIYSCQLYHNFLKELPKEAYYTVPTWEAFKEHHRIGITKGF